MLADKKGPEARIEKRAERRNLQAVVALEICLNSGSLGHYTLHRCRRKGDRFRLGLKVSSDVSGAI